MGFTEILTIVFIVLKLLNVISWSWWLVLLPEIIAWVIYIAVIIYSLYMNHSISKSTKELFKR